MSTPWSEHSEDEQKEILDRLSDIYAEHKNPTWLKPPTFDSQIVNKLTANEQSFTASLKIKGVAPLDEAGTAAALQKSISDTVASISKSWVKIAGAGSLGSQMGVITILNKVYIDGVAAEGSCSVEHKEGQVILLDFWATWCPPSQALMGHNQKMLEERGKDWGDKVRLIGLSIDNDVGTVKNHVESKKWTSVEHYHVRTAGSTAAKDYGLKGVPHVLLVDTKGKIVFMGHPAKREIEKDIDALLQGETLTGAGTGEAAEAKSEDESSGSSASASEMDAAIAKFKVESKEFNEKFLDSCSKLPKAFLVLVDERSYDCQERVMKRSLACHLVLQGPQDVIDEIKSNAASICEGPWKMNFKCTAM